MDYMWMSLIGLHVFFALVWAGGGIILTILVGPALAGTSPAAQGEVGPRLGAQAHRIFRPVATVTILLGILIGAHLGNFSSWQDVVLSAYGRTYLIALALSIGVWCYGEFVIGPLARAISAASPPERPAALKRAMRATAFEKFGFLAILACMVLLRFGV